MFKISTDLIDYGKANLAVRTEQDLPPHITFEQYKKIYYSLGGTDQLLCGLMFESGGRIGDVVKLRWDNFNFDTRLIKMFVDKKDAFITIPMSKQLMSDFKQMFVWVKPDYDDYVFKPVRKNGVVRKSSSVHLTRQGAGWKVRQWGASIGIKLHPHMFRHGLAIYLLSQGVNIKVIAARLGHSSVFTTMNYYLVITPEIQRDMLEGIPMR